MLGSGNDLFTKHQGPCYMDSSPMVLLEKMLEASEFPEHFPHHQGMSSISFILTATLLGGGSALCLMEKSGPER